MAEADSDIVRGIGLYAIFTGDSDPIECRSHSPRGYASGRGDLIIFGRNPSSPSIPPRWIVIGVP